MTTTMITKGIIGLSAIILALLLKHFIQRRTLLMRQRQQAEGVRILNQLRCLLTQIQLHRGLSNGYLSGQKKLFSRIAAISTDINTITAQINQSTPALTQLSRWGAISEHWQRLSKKSLSLPSTNNLQQHNKLVLNILYLIDDVAEHYQLHKVLDKNNQSVQYLWLELLFTAESIGQIRAIGAGVAAQGQCSSAQRIRLNYLCHSLQHSLMVNLSKSNERHILNLLKVTETQIIVAKPTIGADDFFALATECIEDILAYFDQQLSQIERQVTTDHDRHLEPRSEAGK